MLTVGLLVVSPVDSDAWAQKRKSSSKKSSSKKTPSKKTSKKSSSKRSSKKAVASTSRRGKNRNADRSSRASRSRKSAPKPVVVVDPEDEGSEETAGPRPANRYVAQISTTRVIQIQEALIKQGELEGPPTGVYDRETFDAMSRFQSRKGQKPVGNPTAHALKDLGVPKNSGYGTTTPARVVEATTRNP